MRNKQRNRNRNRNWNDFTWKVEVTGRIETEPPARRKQRPGDGRDRFGGPLNVRFGMVGRQQSVPRTPEGTELEQPRVGAWVLAAGDGHGTH